MSADLTLLHGRLLQQPGDVEPLLQRVRRIEALNRVFQRWCAEPWMAALRVANLRGTTLVVYSDNAAALTSLRYRRDDLLLWLRQDQNLAVSQIETRVRPRPRGAAV